MANPPTIEREDTENSSNPLPTPSISDAPPLPTPSLNLPLISPTLNCTHGSMLLSLYLFLRRSSITTAQSHRHPSMNIVGVLGAGPTAAPPFKTQNQCQICKQYNHTALECSNHFNHSYASQVQSSFDAFNITEPPSDVWYPDSGATSHMTGNLSLLQSVIPYSGSQKVMVGNDTLLTISHIGKDIKTMTLVIQCNSRGSLHPIRPPSSASFSALSCSSPVVSLEHAALDSSLSSLSATSLWHRRLGHLSSDVLLRLVRNKNIDCNTFISNTLCNVCELGKQSKLPFSYSTTIVSRPFELIHSDVWQSPILSPSSMRYYVIFSDHLTRYIWCY
ncbi:hypothetical protein LIER_39831 [Lithospermum erythrorhizon]|uniref:GAG-pre-integrase domain-containing protein n=1 Tax=Lithospermum erythrorhizon TaxID=34254 RepID=A0AAV3QPZ0_LITER